MADPPAATAERAEPPPPDRGEPVLGDPARHGWVLVAALLAVAAPLAAAAIGLAVKGWVPVGEYAQAELRIRDFWAHPPVLGAVGRLRTATHVSSHPGPAAWWAMYPVYAALGRSAIGLSTAVAVTAWAWLAGALALLWRRGGDAAAAIGALVVVLLAASLGATAFVEPWNPFFAVPAFLCFLVAVWDLAGDHPWSVVLVVAAGSYCVQAHVGYAPVIGVLALWSLGAWFLHRRRAPETRPVIPPLAVAAATAVAMWVLPLAQQLSGHPGNLTILLDSYRLEAGRQAALGLGGALKLVGGLLDVRAPFLVTEITAPVDRAPGLGTLALGVAWALAAEICRRRRHQQPYGGLLRLHGALAVGFLAAVVAASRIVGEVYGYLILWLAVLVSMVVLAVLWTTWAAWIDTEDSSERRRLGGRAALGATVLLATVATTVDFADPPVPAAALSADASELVPPVATRLDPSGTHLLRWDDPVAFGALGTALLSELERRGYTVVVDPSLSVEMRPHRVVGRSGADDALWVVTGADIARWRELPGAQELAMVDRRTADQKRESARLSARIEDRLRRIGGDELADRLRTNLFATRSDPRVPARLAAEIDRLGELGQPSAVFLAPVDLSPPARS